MSPSPTRLDRRQLEAAEVLRRIPGRNGTKADLLFYELGEQRIAVKTYSERPFLVRQVLGRWLTRRESRAYEAGRGAPGLPAFLGRLDSFSLATEWVDGVPLSDLRGETVDPTIFDRVLAIVERLHARGLALGDLHHRDVLVAPDGSVTLVDLATGWALGERPSSLRRILFRRFCDADLVGLARMRARFTGQDIDQAVQAVGPAAAAWHRRGRKAKVLLDRLRGRR